MYVLVSLLFTEWVRRFILWNDVFIMWGICSHQVRHLIHRLLNFERNKTKQQQIYRTSYILRIIYFCFTCLQFFFFSFWYWSQSTQVLLFYWNWQWKTMNQILKLVEVWWDRWNAIKLMNFLFFDFIIVFHLNEENNFFRSFHNDSIHLNRIGTAQTS